MRPVAEDSAGQRGEHRVRSDLDEGAGSGRIHVFDHLEETHRCGDLVGQGPAHCLRLGLVWFRRGVREHWNRRMAEIDVGQKSRERLTRSCHDR